MDRIRNRYNKTGPKPIPIEDRYWEKVNIKNNDECWNWLAAQDGHGRGVVRYNNKNVVAHRISYLLHYGELNKDLNILHKCDNPICCNPHHLKQGTQAENMQECRDRGRNYNPNGTKLDWNKVREIRYYSFHMRYSSYKLASMFGVSRPNINQVVNNKTWKETREIARSRYGDELKKYYDAYDKQIELIAIRRGYKVPKSIYLW